MFNSCNEINTLKGLNTRFSGNGFKLRNKPVMTSSDKHQFHFLEPQKIEGFLIYCTDSFCQKLNQVESKKDLAKALSYYFQVFISIHPFSDANGRTLKKYLRQIGNQFNYNLIINDIDDFSFNTITQKTLTFYEKYFYKALHEK